MLPHSAEAEVCISCREFSRTDLGATKDQWQLVVLSDSLGMADVK